MLHIKLAVTPMELQECFKLRNEVYNTQHKFFSTKDKQDVVCDEYDFLEGTKHIIATLDDKVIGTMRYTDSHTNSAQPTNKFFNFDEIVGNKKWCAGSMFAVESFSEIEEPMIMDVAS